MSNIKKLTYFLVLLCLIASRLTAQQPYSIIHYDESVLPQTSIGNIQQDKDGFLWMSSQYGIVRFDGEKFRVFSTDNVPELTSNRIRLCAKGPDGTIYFVDENQAILRVKSSNDFEKIGQLQSRKNFVGLYTSYCNNDFDFAPLKNSSLPQWVRELNLDTSRELMKTFFLGQKSGYIFYADLDQKLRLCYYEDSVFLTRPLDPSIRIQHSGKLDGRIFTQTAYNAGLLYSKSGPPKKIDIKGLPESFAQRFNESPVVVFSNETGAYFYSDGSLYQYRWQGTTLEATLVFSNLPCTGVWGVTKERVTGDYLISTMNNGFYRIKKKQFDVLNVTGPNGAGGVAQTSLFGNVVYSLSFWDTRHIYTTGVIKSIDGSGNAKAFDPVNNTLYYHYFSYAKDSTHFWFNKNLGELSFLQSYDRRTEKFKIIASILTPRQVIEIDKKKSLVIGRYEIIRLENDVATSIVKSDSLEFTSGVKISGNSVAVGTSKAICYLDLATGKLSPVAYPTQLKVRFVFKDRTGRIWFTTYGQGLFHLSDKTIVPIPSDNANYLAIGHNIFEDRSGNFWVSTNHGLFKLSYASMISIISGRSDKLYYVYFDKTDGFNTNEFNGGGFPSNLYQDQTGLLFLPSMDGIVKFNPDSVANVNINSSIFFDEIRVNDTGKIYQLPPKIVFAKNTTTIDILFSSPYYGHVENIKYSYALSTDPDRWIDLKGRRTISLSNLPGGSYSVVVKKEDASNAPVLATLHFEIERKFTETIFFWLLLLGIITGLVYLYFRARILYLNRERKRLEREVAARTADQLNLIRKLQINIDQLKQLQAELSQLIDHKENVIAILIHDIKSPLHFLNTVAGLLDKGIDKNPPEKNKKIANEISLSLNRLYIFTQDFATWLQSSRPGYIQQQVHIDLQEIVSQVLTIYEGIIEKKEITVDLSIDVTHVFGDEPMIKSIIRNLVDNALKNMVTGKITVHAQSAAGYCKIIIADEGKGMTSDQLEGMNSFFENPDQRQAFAGNGFGHRVVRDFLVKSEGYTYYRSNTPQGVIVELTLPTGPGISSELPA